MDVPRKDSDGGSHMLIYLQMIESADDKVKFETLYQAYSDYMYRVALAILRNVQDAEDAVHYAFVKIAEKALMFLQKTQKQLDVSSVKKS